MTWESEGGIYGDWTLGSKNLKMLVIMRSLELGGEFSMGSIIWENFREEV